MTKSTKYIGIFAFLILILGSCFRDSDKMESEKVKMQGSYTYNLKDIINEINLDVRYANNEVCFVAMSKLINDTLVIKRSKEEYLETHFEKDFRLLSEPFLFARIFGDKVYVVFKERLHNGTLYNAVVERYYLVDILKGKFTYSFSFEIIAWNSLAKEFVFRTMDELGNCNMEVSKSLGGKREPVAEYLLKLNNSGDVLIEEVSITNGMYKNALVTSSPEMKIPNPTQY